MWPLLALSVLGITVISWRRWALRQATSGVAPFLKELRSRLVGGDVPGAIAVCERHGGPVASIVKAGLLRFGTPKDEVERALQDASAHELSILERSARADCARAGSRARWWWTRSFAGTALSATSPS
jgi:biopolymer transport protein ExbB